MASHLFEMASAGIQPTSVNPLAVQVLAELGSDISHHTAKHGDSLSAQKFTYVITVCDRVQETCLTFHANTRPLHWSFIDPAEAKGDENYRMSVFRHVHDEIVEHVTYFTSNTLQLICNLKRPARQNTAREVTTSNC
jgi:protein-tyrosine-phosphatase